MFNLHDPYYLNDRTLVINRNVTEQTIEALGRHGGPHDASEECLAALDPSVAKLASTFRTFAEHNLRDVTLVRFNGSYQIANGRHRIGLLWTCISSGCRSLLNPCWPETLAEFLEMQLTFSVLCDKRGNEDLLPKAVAGWIVMQTEKEEKAVPRGEGDKTNNSIQALLMNVER